MPVHTLRDAISLLRSDERIELVAGGLHFDESRMFDLLRYVRAFSATPFVSCRVLETVLPQTAIDAVALSSVGLGAATFFDLPAEARRCGTEEAEDAFRSLLLRHLRAPLRSLTAAQA